MIELAGEQLYKEMLERAKCTEGEDLHGFARFVDSTVALEKALAVLTKCQTLQTNTCQLLMKKQAAPFSAKPFMNWLEASNRWLEAMIMLHWVTLNRLSGIFPYRIARLESWKNKSHPDAIMEAQMQTTTAAYALVESQILLFSQLLNHLNRPSSKNPYTDKVGREALLTLHHVGEMLRILVRKHKMLTELEEEKIGALDPTLQDLRSSLRASAKKLEGQLAPAPLISQDFIAQVKEALQRLIEPHGGSQPTTSVQVFFPPDPPLPEPWLNEEIFGRLSKGRNRK
jgi:hypothetical protein